MDRTRAAPTYDELTAIADRFRYLEAIENPDARLDAAESALLALVPAERRREAEHLVFRLRETAKGVGQDFVAGELALVARHFGTLEHAILAVYSHVLETAGGKDDCDCPVGKAPA